VTDKRRTTSEEARRVGDAIGVDWSRFDLEQFRAGMDVEFEHGSHDPQTDVTHDDPILTGKIALAHMKEFPDYYERLERMEREAERDWARYARCFAAPGSVGAPMAGVPLLRTVVKIALDLPASVVRRSDDPPARGVEL
jgi:Protein of unknown function (DUF5661)